MRTFKEKLVDWIALLDQWLSEPEDEVQLSDWIHSAEELAYSFEFSKEEELYIDQIIECSISYFKQKIDSSLPQSMVTSEVLNALLMRKQTEQRTAAWYEQMSTILSASELGNLFGSERQRAKFVLSKTVPYQPRMQPLAVPSDYMSAFDWGIRFEPVVKQIYEHKHGVTIKDLGRMHHPEDPRCTASPDGIIDYCPLQQRTGRLIEIKCPVTREIDGTIPKDYYAQMQMQLHVTGMKQCDYVEAVFSSRYNQLHIKEGPSMYEGYFAVIRYVEPKDGQDFYYIYSPLNPGIDWIPAIDIGEEIIEITPWRLYQWSEQLVLRKEEWWTGMQPIFQSFWSDVEKAKEGGLIIPDSTRPSKKQKTERCIIQFPIIVHKLDEMES
jgi:putative phage-type endonuclease